MTPSSLAGLLAERAASAGSSVAVEGPDGRRTFAELWEGAGRRADDLIHRASPSPVVALAVTPHRVAQIEALCGLLGGGLPALLLDPLAPEALRHRWLEAAGTHRLLDEHGIRATDDVQPGQPERFAEPGEAPVVEGDQIGIITPHPDSEPGALLWSSHRLLLGQAEADARQLGLTPGDRVGCALPLSSPLGVRALLAAWHAGATAVVFDPRRDGWLPLSAWIADQRVTVTPLTPALIELAALSGPATVPDPRTVALDPALTPEDLRDEAPPEEPDEAPAAAALVAIWEELLEVRPVPRDRDFFDLGGHSLLAARMLVLLEQQTGVRLPMAVFLDATTIDELADAADRPAEPPIDRTVVCIQAGAPGRAPLFVAHDLQGSAWRFRPLAEAVGTEQPVYGFESPMLEGRLPFATVEALAAHYLDALKTVQPEGPYHLAGYSFGGILAFEMARLLRHGGEVVGLLGVIDVGPGYRGLDYSRTHLPPLPYLHDAVDRPGGRLPPWAAPVRRLWLNQRVLARRWRRTLRAGDEVAADERLWFAWWAHWNLVGPQWTASDYDGRIDLFWAQTTEGTDATMGWGAHAPEVVVHPIAGRHESLMAPPTVDLIGAGLRALLPRRRLRSSPAPTSEILAEKHP